MGARLASIKINLSLLVKTVSKRRLIAAPSHRLNCLPTVNQPKIGGLMNLRWKLCNLRQLKAFGPIFGKNLKYYFTAVRFGAQALGALAIETLAPVLWVQTNSTRCRLLGRGINHTIRTHFAQPVTGAPNGCDFAVGTLFSQIDLWSASQSLGDPKLSLARREIFRRPTRPYSPFPPMSQPVDRYGRSGRRPQRCPVSSFLCCQALL